MLAQYAGRLERIEADKMFRVPLVQGHGHRELMINDQHILARECSFKMLRNELHTVSLSSDVAVRASLIKHPGRLFLTE